MGLRPIVLERGKEVRQRTKDTWGLWRQSVLNPESNVQFGEGGAGTFSDGKLYSQIDDIPSAGKLDARAMARYGRYLWALGRVGALQHHRVVPA